MFVVGDKRPLLMTSGGVRASTSGDKQSCNFISGDTRPGDSIRGERRLDVLKSGDICSGDHCLKKDVKLWRSPMLGCSENAG